MSFFRDKRKRKIFIWITSVALALAITVGACTIYLGDYYRADTDAIAAFSAATDVTFRELDGGTLVFEPENPVAGIIFYPGGKVEYTAYRPLMEALAERGILSVLIKMPFNLAVLDVNAADGVKESFPEVGRWYIGGHSLGGSMAASYLKKHANEFEGLILLGAYSTADLSGTELDVLSVFGSEDKVMNREKYEKNKPNLPPDFEELVIDGGCHAYFGMYGAQDDDGTPTISNSAQITLTANAVAGMMYKK